MEPSKLKEFESKLNVSLFAQHKWFYKHQKHIKPEYFLSDVNRTAYVYLRDGLTTGTHVDIMALVAKNSMYTELMTQPQAATEVEFLHALETITNEYQKRELVRVCTHSIQRLQNDGGAATEVKNNIMERLTVLRDSSTHQKTNTEILQELTKRMESKTKMIGITTGYDTLDGVTFGMAKTNLILVAARPSQGKTAFSINMAMRQAIAGKKVLFFNIEMNVADLMARFIAAFKKAYLSNILSGNIPMDEWHAEYLTGLEWLDNITIIDNVGNVNDVISEIYNQINTVGLDAVYIDYLQLMSGPGRDKNEKYGNISFQLKMCAKALNIPIVLLSQLSREVEKRPDKRPVLSDLRDSGELEQNADVVIMLYRLEMYKIFEDAAGQSTRGMMYVAITKNRNGTLSDIVLRYIGPCVRVEDLTEYGTNETIKEHAKNESEDIAGFDTENESVDF